MLSIFKKESFAKKNIILFGLDNTIQLDLFFSLLKNNHFVIGVFETEETKEIIHKELYNLNILNCEFELFHLKNFNKDSFHELFSFLTNLNFQCDYLIYNPILNSYNISSHISSSEFPKTLAKETSFLLRVNEFFNVFFNKNSRILFLSNPFLFSIKGYESNKAIYKQLKSLSKIILPKNKNVISYYHSALDNNSSAHILENLSQLNFNENMLNNFVDFIEKDFHFSPYKLNFSLDHCSKIFFFKFKQQILDKTKKKTKPLS